MPDMAYLRENIETVHPHLANPGFSFDVETFQRLDGERKTVIHEVELPGKRVVPETIV